MRILLIMLGIQIEYSDGIVGSFDSTSDEGSTFVKLSVETSIIY